MPFYTLHNDDGAELLLINPGKKWWGCTFLRVLLCCSTAGMLWFTAGMLGDTGGRTGTFFGEIPFEDGTARPKSLVPPFTLYWGGYRGAENRETVKKRPKTENRQKTALKKAKNRKPPKNRPKKGQKPKTAQNCGFKAKDWKSHLYCIVSCTTISKKYLLSAREHVTNQIMYIIMCIR